MDKKFGELIDGGDNYEDHLRWLETKALRDRLAAAEELVAAYRKAALEAQEFLVEVQKESIRVGLALSEVTRRLLEISGPRLDARTRHSWDPEYTREDD